MDWYNKFDLIPCECGRQLRHLIADESFGCLTCRQDKTNAAAQASIEWSMVGEKAVNWEAALALSAGAHKCDEADYRASRQRSGRDD